MKIYLIMIMLLMSGDQPEILTQRATLMILMLKQQLKRKVQAMLKIMKH